MTGLNAAQALPDALEPLRQLATDLRWTWSHAGDRIWQALDPVRWAESENPWTLLRDVSHEALERFANDPTAMHEMHRLDEERRRYLADGGWFATSRPGVVRGAAYLSMEFGLDEALPLYAGGLGVLAGDYLKAASDLGVPVIGVGLLYQQGNFRQTIDANGRQHELYPHIDPALLPITPTIAGDGSWLHIVLDLPGRSLRLRVWHATVGRTRLYLLDSNDDLNTPADRGITAKLYGGDPDVQFLQEVVLGIGGWRLIDALGLDIEICHLNEGHAALAVLERARSFMERTGVTFLEAFWATRAGNVFTTHTARPAAFDRFGPPFREAHQPYLHAFAEGVGVPMHELLALGRRDATDVNEPFNLAHLAMRGSISVSGVSALHGEVSRRLFRELYPRWPEHEVPVGHITNGVHAPTWDSPSADRLWERRCGKDRWHGELTSVGNSIAAASDDDLWTVRSEGRRTLVAVVRRRLARQLTSRGADSAALARGRAALDPHALTLGFARRFTPYKRPTLLLRDKARLVRLLTDPYWPIQIVVAGKAHPAEGAGKRMISEWVELAQDPRLRHRLVFLEDYDVTLAQQMVRGVDVWMNTPRRPWEASGTSGMKVLVNGGLNLSVLDGWWAEAYTSKVGWAIGDAAAHDDGERDAVEADQLYRVLEQEIVPEFYERDARGLPARWLARVRASMSELAPRFSTNRMLREYVDKAYVPAAARFRARVRDNGRLASELAVWSATIDQAWSTVHFGELEVRAERDGYLFALPVDVGSLDWCSVKVELYAEPLGDATAIRIPMQRAGTESCGAPSIHTAFVATSRPASHFTPRVVAFHEQASVPAEAAQIHWQR